MSMMVSFVLSFFPRDVLDEILNLIGSVSEDFPSYSFNIGKLYAVQKIHCIYRGYNNNSVIIITKILLLLSSLLLLYHKYSF